MIRIKVEEEEEVTPLSIESENEQIKRLLSLKFSSNNNNSLNNVGGGSTTSDINCGNFFGTLKLPENNVVVPMKVVPKKKKKKKPKQKLDNFSTNSVAVCSKSIKTEPAESSLSLTTQLNNSLNIQSLLRQNRIQNGWTTNEQSIPIGTQQQQQSLLSTTTIEPIVPEIHQEVPSLVQSASIPIGTQLQQSLLLPKIEPIIPETHQEVSLSLDLSSLIPNLDSEQTANCDTAEIPSLVQSSSLIPIGTQQQQSFLTKIESIVPGIHQEVPLLLDQSSLISIQTQQQQSLLLPKIELIVPEIHQEVSLSLDLSSLITNLDSEQTPNCDTAEIPSLVQSSSSIPIGTQQQQQSYFLPKIEPIVSESQEVPLSLDLSSLISNLDSEETANYDTSEVLFLDQGSSIPIGTQQQQSFLVPKIERIVPEKHQEVPLLEQSFSSVPIGTKQQQQRSFLLPKIIPTVSIVPLLDQCFSNPNPKSGETTTANCDTTTTGIPLLDLSFYSVPIGTQQQQSNLLFTKIKPIVSENQSSSIPNLNSGETTTTTNCDTSEIPLSLDQSSSSLIPNGTQQQQTHRKKVIPEKEPLVDPEVITVKIQSEKMEYQRKYRQQRLTSATPEQLEQKRLKQLEYFRRRREKETEEQRKQRLERARKYQQTVGKQRLEQRKMNKILEELEKKRALTRKYNYNYKQRKLMKSLEQQSGESLQTLMSLSTSSINLEMDISKCSTLKSSFRNYSRNKKH